MRHYRQLWLWLGGIFLALFPFFAAIAIAYFLKEPGYSLFGNIWMPGAFVALAAAFAAFFGAISGWPFPPWAQARFPDLRVEILSTGSTDTERESSSGLDMPAHLRSFNVRLTSLERERSASVAVLLHVKLAAGAWGDAQEGVCPQPTWTLPPSLGLNPLTMPRTLAPGAGISGQLVYEIPRYYVGKMADPFSARLEIVDNPSGRSMSIPAELGVYDRSSMFRGAGGADTVAVENGAQKAVT